MVGSLRLFSPFIFVVAAPASAGVQAHTKNCASCLGALKNVKKMLTAAKTSAVISFAWV